MPFVHRLFLVGTPAAAALVAVLFLLLAFDVTSLGVNDPRYGNFSAWLYLAVGAIAISMVVMVRRFWFGPLRLYPVVVGGGVILSALNVNPILVTKQGSAAILLLVAMEGLRQWKQASR